MAKGTPQHGVEVGGKHAGWTVQRVIGKGSSGTVYEVRKRNQRAALKVILPDVTNEEALPRFRREVKLLSEVRHPNVVRLLSWGEGEFFWLILEYLPNSVDGFLAEHERANVPQAVGILRAVLDGLQAIHERGIVHRDVKPDNLLLGQGNQIKLADFGLARRDSSSTSLTRTGVVMGTPFYMSPEQCQGRDLDGRADLYSCGVLLYHLLTGGPPYANHSALQVLQCTMTGVPDLRDALPGAPPQLRAQVLMAKRPEDRPGQRQGGEGLVRRAARGAPLRPSARLGRSSSGFAAGAGRGGSAAPSPSHAHPAPSSKRAGGLWPRAPAAPGPRAQPLARPLREAAGVRRRSTPRTGSRAASSRRRPGRRRPPGPTPRPPGRRSRHPALRRSRSPGTRWRRGSLPDGPVVFL
ncbi:MAG: serine/threonine-protein kinase [Planctomycetota bacterium]